MVVLDVYAKTINVTYKSTLLSKATFVYVITTILSIVLPYIFAYQSGGFWIKWDHFYEQPKVDVRGEHLLIAMTTNLSHPIVCSTFSFYKQNLNNFDACSTIKLREIDHNFDGKADKLEFSVKINLLESQIRSLYLVLPINYSLNTICPIKMQSAIILQHYFCEKTVSELHTMADLELYQVYSIHCYTNSLDHFYDTSIIDGEESEEYKIENIIEKYLERNLTTHLRNVYTNIRNENSNIFNLKLSVRYPEHHIHYHPGNWQIIKMAWIQYIAVLIIVMSVIQKVKSYVFDNKLVLTYEDSPFKKQV